MGQFAIRPEETVPQWLWRMFGIAYVFAMVVVLIQVASHYGLIAGDLALWVMAGIGNLWVVNKPARERFHDFLGCSAFCGVVLVVLLVVQSLPQP